MVCRLAGLSEYDPAAYARVFGAPLTAAQIRTAERRMTAAEAEEDPLETLVVASPQRLAEWMIQRAVVADGAPSHMPVADPETVSHVIAEMRALAGDWALTRTPRALSGWFVIAVALIRELCAASFMEVQRHVSCGFSRVYRAWQLHGVLLRSDALYACRAGELAREILRRCTPE
jgi:hypothetical protein